MDVVILGFIPLQIRTNKILICNRIFATKIIHVFHHQVNIFILFINFESPEASYLFGFDITYDKI